MLSAANLTLWRGPNCLFENLSFQVGEAGLGTTDGFVNNLDELQLFGLVEMVLFMLILGVAYVYIWGRGGLEWD